MPYTNQTLQEYKDMPKAIQNQMEQAFLTEEELQQRRLQQFKQKENVYGSTVETTNSNEMVDIAARFITNSVAALEDPAFDCIQLQINWDEKQGLFADESNTDSALCYLKETGEQIRYEQLKQVIQWMHELFDATQDRLPQSYYLTGIDGLGQFNENYRKVGVPNELVLHCIDDVKWKTRAIAMNLNNIVYDTIRQITVLPRNLQRFSCTLFVSDVRNLSNVYADDPQYDKQLSAHGILKPNNPSAKKVFFDMQAQQKQAILINGYTCYLGANSFPESISNIEQNPLNNDFKLSIYNWSYDALYPALDAYISQLEREAEPVDDTNVYLKMLRNYSCRLIAGYIDSAVQLTRSYATNTMATLVGMTSLREITNKVLAFTKPSVIQAKYGKQLTGWLDDVFGLNQQLMQQTYFNDSRQASYTLPEDKQYFTEPRRATELELEDKTYFTEHQVAGDAQ